MSNTKSTFHLLLKESLTCTVKSPLWLHISSFLLSDWPLSEVSWFNWMSQSRELCCSHAVVTLRCEGRFFFTLHEPRLWTYHVWDWSAKGDVLHYWLSDCLFHTSINTPEILFCFFFEILLKMEGEDVFKVFGCFLCTCWSCSHFSTNWKANCSEVDACS